MAIRYGVSPGAVKDWTTEEYGEALTLMAADADVQEELAKRAKQRS
jgi:hypothetical protein